MRTVDVFFLLSACSLSSKSPSIEQVDEVPKALQEQLDPSDTLQLATQKEKIYYVVYQSADTVTVTVEKQGGKLNIKLKKVSQNSDVVEPYIFKLKVDDDSETIDVFVDDQSIPIDNMILY